MRSIKVQLLLIEATPVVVVVDFVVIDIVVFVVNVIVVALLVVTDHIIFSCGQYSIKTPEG